MKFNYQNPKTGKQSSIVLADYWVKVYLAVMSDLFDDHDLLPVSKRQAITHMMQCCVKKYFSPIGNCPFSHEFLIRPGDCTFTAFVENYMASQIYHRAVDPYKIAHSKQKEPL